MTLQIGKRAHANEAGVDFVLKLRADHGEPTIDLDAVTPADELELISFYAYKLAAKGLDLWPRKVIATAVTFLKRFYLDHSIIQYEVRKIAFACLYIAGKVCRGCRKHNLYHLLQTYCPDVSISTL